MTAAVLVAVLTTIPLALLGCYLVLRRMSMIGDAISHGVLPGIVLGVLLSGQLTGWPIIVGAMIFGLLTAFLTQTLHTYGKVSEDAGMGVVFTSLFALGVILIFRISFRAHLDVDCVLYGNLLFVTLHTYDLFGFEIPVAANTMAFVLIATVGFVWMFWKELKITSFDPALATAMGINANVTHYLLMGMVAVVTVTAFEVVGSIIVLAMLIVPAACAQMMTDRLGLMMFWACVVAVLSSVLGYMFADWLVTSVAGMMGVVAGCLFAAAVIAAPHHGLFARWLRNLRLRLRIIAEDVLAGLYRREEKNETATGIVTDTGSGALRSMVCRWLHHNHEIAYDAQGRLALTDTGRRRAASIVRAHRLWEAYLGKHFDLPLDHLHDPAARMEHFLDPELQQQLEAELDQPKTDPHGRVIPTPDIIPHAGKNA